MDMNLPMIIMTTMHLTFHIGTPDKEYDLMINKLRNQILKASPHAQIRRQIGINGIEERNQHLAL